MRFGRKIEIQIMISYLWVTSSWRQILYCVNIWSGSHFDWIYLKITTRATGRTFDEKYFFFCLWIKVKSNHFCCWTCALLGCCCGHCGAAGGRGGGKTGKRKSIARFSILDFLSSFETTKNKSKNKIK